MPEEMCIRDSPLPGVFEFGYVPGFIVGGVQVVNAGFQAGVHQVQILVGTVSYTHLDVYKRQGPGMGAVAERWKIEGILSEGP